MGEAEAGQVLVWHQQDPAAGTDADLQVAKSIERIRASARGDATAVLRPRRCVLNVPELPVGGGEARHGVEAKGHQRHGPGQAPGEATEHACHAAY